MKASRLFGFVIGLLVTVQTSHGMRTSRIGPDSANPHPTTEQQDWPKGLVELVWRESRVYSVWVNGNENFYFKADAKEINELIRLFSQARMRDHELIIKTGKPKVKSFKSDEFEYNVNLHIIAGIAMHMTRRADEPRTHEPPLTIYVDPDGDHAWLKTIHLPANIILNSAIENLPLKGKAVRPERMFRHAEVQFEDGTPAADLENGVSTRVTFWETGEPAGIDLGHIGNKGYFRAPFSDREIAELEAGASWLTLTVGNWSTKAKPEHPRLAASNLALDESETKVIQLARPGFYHGRILFEDGTPPILDPIPWPGAKIQINFPYTNGGAPDPAGYFKVYFTDEQFEKLKDEKTRRNIYIPSYERRGSSRALFAFPAAKLSKSKQDAGVVKIPKPAPKPAQK